MTDRDAPWPAGTPCWADVGVRDAEAARAFYAAVLGWDWEPPVVTYGDSGYWNALLRGRRVAGLSPLEPGAPAGWTLWFATDDADATAAAIEAAGGTVGVPPMDVMDLGRMTLASDPTGVRFGAWEAGTHVGAALVNEPGALVWEDLRSTDPAAAQAFYAAVFGFATQPLLESYVLFRRPDEDFPLGGMGPTFDLPGDPRWEVVFQVTDADAAAAAAVDAGGSVAVAAHDSDFGRIAGLADPEGGHFSVIAPPPDQPRPER